MVSKTGIRETQFASHLAPDLSKYLDRRLWVTFAILCAIVALGAFLRARSLTLDPIWLDEVFTINTSDISLFKMWTSSVDPTPPLYFTLQKIFAGQADDAATVRMVSLVAGILTIPVVYLVGSEAAGKPVGFLSAAFVACADGMIEYSQEARAYAVLCLMVSLAAYFTLRVHRKAQGTEFVQPLLLANLAMILGCLTHYTFIVWASLTQVLIFVSVRRVSEDREARMRRYYKTMGISLIAALPLLNLFAQSFDTHGIGWIPRSDLEWLQLTYEELLMLRGFDGPMAFLVVPLGIGVIFGLRKHWANDKVTGFVILSLVAYPLLLWLVSFAKPILIYRTGLPGSIGLMIALAIGVLSLPRIWNWGAAACVAMLFIASHVQLEAKGRTIGDYMWAIADVIREQSMPGDTVVFSPGFTRAILYYHLGPDFPLPLYLVEDEAPRKFVAPSEVERPWVTIENGDGSLIGTVENLLASSERIWVVSTFQNDNATDIASGWEAFVQTVAFEKDGDHLLLLTRPQGTTEN